MYAKYQTEALVLGARPSGEADKLLTLYTRDFGLIRARASAVRREGSRMRYALQNYSYAHVALVRGSRGWRVAGAVAHSNMHSTDMHRAFAFARVASLVSRLGGEEKNEYLFSALAEAHTALASSDAGAHATIELVCVARTLFSLGYLSAEALGTGHASFSAENVRDPASPGQAPALRRGPTPVSLFTHTAYANEHLQEAETLREKLLSSVNRAMTETHL